MELKCPGCSARFRLTVTSQSLPDETVACPKCGTAIPLRTSDTSSGWAPRERSQIFGRAPESKPASRAPNRQRPARGTPRRQFRDITTVDSGAPPPREPLDDGDNGEDDAWQQKPTVETKRPEELRRTEPVDPDPTLEQPLPTSAIVKRSGIGVGSQRQEQAKEQVKEEEQEPELVQELEPEREPEPEQELEPEKEPGQEPELEQELKPEKEPGQEPELEQEPAQESEPEREQPDSTEAATKRSTAELLRMVRERMGKTPSPAIDEVDLLVGDRTFDAVSIEQLAEVLARGVIPESLKVRADSDEEWRSLVEHPVYVRVTESLTERSEAVLEEVLTGEVERDDAQDDDTQADDAQADDAQDDDAQADDAQADDAQDDDVLVEAEHTDEAELPMPPAPPESVQPAPEPEPTPTPTPPPALPEPTPTLQKAPPPPKAPTPTPTEAPTNPRIEDASAADASSISMEFSTRRPGRRFLLPILVMVAIGAGGLAAYTWAPDFRPEPVAPRPTPPPPPRDALRAGFSIADKSQAIANRIAALRRRETGDVMSDARAQLDKSNFGDALALSTELRRRAPNNPEVTSMLARAHAGTGDWKAARRVIAEFAARREVPRSLEVTYRETLQADPSLPPPTLTFPRDQSIELIRALGGGRSLSFKMYRDGEKVYAYKPAQTEWDDGWRSEIAAYTLCELIPCGFDVPASFTGRIEQSDWQGLYPLTTVKQAEYAARFDRLKWRTEPTENGDDVQVLYGVAKRWVPSFTDWPIEYTDVWHPWVDPERDPKLLEAPIDQSLQPLGGRGEYYTNLLGELDGEPTSAIARQLSNIMVFDFLINNWDRFSTVEEYYGVNNQFANGRFVSIDNGAGFSLQESERVTARFASVGRFSRSMIAAVRLLDRDLVDPLLFPNATDEERIRLDLFWQRREQLLERVDALIEQHGKAAVLYFE